MHRYLCLLPARPHTQDGPLCSRTMTDILNRDRVTQVQEIAGKLETQLPGWSMDCAFAFGSTARDESLPDSDVDLWFVGHAAGRIYLDKVWSAGRFAESTGEFLRAHPDLEVVEIDSWGSLYHSTGMTAPLAFGSPIADVRWLLWQLAGEAEWQTFLFVATGQAVVDPEGFYGSLQEFLWDKLPFHLHPEHGIVHRLKLLCVAEKARLLADLASLSGQEAHGATTDHTIWLWPAVQCIRDTVFLLTLVMRGRPIFRRTDVLSFIEEAFPQNLDWARQVYEYKATPAGRRQLGGILNSPPETRSLALRPITDGVLAFWHAAMAEVDSTIVRGQSRISYAGPEWREQNDRAYGRFLKSLPAPQFR